MKPPDDLPEDHRRIPGRITGWVAGQPPNVILEAIRSAVAEERERSVTVLRGLICHGHQEPLQLLECRCPYCDRLWQAITAIRAREP